MLKIGDRVNFKDDNGAWSKKVFTVTGFITDEQMQNELDAQHHYTRLKIGGGSESITEPLYKNKDEIRNVYLNWDCHWFPIQAKRLRLAQ